MRQPKLSDEINLPDWLTVAAIAVIVYALTVFIHEALGHGLTAWFLGMKPHGLTSISLELNWASASLWQIRIVGAAGTGVNILAGAIFYLLLKTRIRSGSVYYFCWLLMIVNLLHGGGYLLINFFFGDWRYVAATLEQQVVWQIVFLVVGLLIYFGGGMILAMRTVEPLISVSPAERLAQARRLMWISYFTGSLTLACAALFHEPAAGIFPVAIAEGFGATSLLLFLPSVVEKPKGAAYKQKFVLTKNYRWISAGAAFFLIFVFLLGRGINF